MDILPLHLPRALLNTRPKLLNKGQKLL